MSSPLEMQPPVLMNRFIIDLKSLSTASGSSQCSSARQHWSRFSAPNFHIPDSGSFLGNIGGDLQDGHEPTDNDLNGHHEIEDICLKIERSPGAQLEATITIPGFSTSHPVDAQVSPRIPSRSKRCDRTLFRLGWSSG